MISLVTIPVSYSKEESVGKQKRGQYPRVYKIEKIKDNIANLFLDKEVLNDKERRSTQ
jgi:hypothetical protein